MPSLFELDQEFQVLEQMLEDEDCDRESFEKAMTALNIEIEAKAANAGLYVKSLQSDIAAREHEVKRLKAKNETDKKRIEWLRGYLTEHLRENVKTPLVSISKQKGSESVEITDDLLFPYWIPQDDKPDKARARKELKEGEQVPGCKLVRGPETVRIQ